MLCFSRILSWGEAAGSKKMVKIYLINIILWRATVLWKMFFFLLYSAATGDGCMMMLNVFFFFVVGGGVLLLAHFVFSKSKSKLEKCAKNLQRLILLYLILSVFICTFRNVVHFSPRVLRKNFVQGISTICHQLQVEVADVSV